MIRKIILPAALFLTLSLLAGCGSSGISSEPVGVNKSLPSIVQLIPVQQVVQTNSTIDLKAKVLDGNGRAVPNVPVIFTNLSLVGVLNSTQAMTDSLGFATVTLFSTDTGFATVQAEVNTGAGKVRVKKTVFFSIFDLTLPTAVSTVPTLTLAVDNNNDNSFNDPTDFIFFDPADPHDEAIVRATVNNANGNPVLNDTVTYAADSTEASFPDGNVKSTNSDGQAFARIKITPTELRNFTVPLNVNAVSTVTGAANVISLFIGPITVNQVTVVADPQSVASGGTSKITATVKTVAGTFVPDGTTVNFTANRGNITPFAQTTGGLATATFTAPTVTATTIATITASAAGKSGTVNVTVTAATAPPPTAVVANPVNASLHCGGTPLAAATIFLSGGTPPYSIQAAISTDPLTVCVGTTCTSATVKNVSVATSGGSFTVQPSGTAPTGACSEVVGAGSVFNLLVSDSSAPKQVITVPITLTNP